MDLRYILDNKVQKTFVSKRIDAAQMKIFILTCTYSYLFIHLFDMKVCDTIKQWTNSEPVLLARD